MSQIRLPTILSRALRGSWLGIGSSSRSKNTWNPPKIVTEMQGEEISTRAMTQDDLPDVISLNRSRQVVDFAESDIPCAMQCSNFYGVVAENSAGQMIGCLSSMLYGGYFLSPGHAIVTPAYRTRRIPALAFDYFKRFVKSEGLEYYAYISENKKSFIAQMDARPDYTQGAYLRIVGNFTGMFLKANTHADVVINELHGGSLEALLQYDESVHVFDRRNLMCEIIDHPSTRTFVAYRDNVICGYGILTKCFLSYKIAPLFADNPHVARELYRRMGQEAPPDCPISMAVSTRNGAAMDIIKENTFSVVKQVHRVQAIRETSGSDIDIKYTKVFSLTNLSLCVC